MLPAIAAALALTAAAPADAYVIGGRPWPAGRVSYYPGGGTRGRAIDRAARTWNRARVGVRFVKTARSRAAVTFGSAGRGCGGSSPLGYLRGFRTRVMLGTGCNTGLLTLTAAHEFGHVLGLGHEQGRCALMNPWADQTGTPNRCPRHSIGFWVARPLQADDLRGARALYGH